MTTSASGRVRISACDGVTVAFSCPQFRKNSELQVWLLDSATQKPETGTLLGEGANYTIVGSPIAGTATVNTLVAYAAGKYLCRKRVTSRAQQVEIEPNQGVPAATQEDALDRLSMVDEELDDTLGDVGARAILVPAGETAAPLPAKAARAGKFAVFNADGDIVATPSASGADAALRTDLAAAGGALLLGSSGGISVQAQLDKIGTKDLGVLSAAGDTPFVIAKSATANPAGTSDWRALVHKLTLGGGFGATQITGVNHQLDLRHNGGTITFAHGIQGYSRLGLAGSVVGGVTQLNGIEWHVAHEGNTGVIGSSRVFRAGDIDLADGNGTISSHAALSIGDQGHATRITGSSGGVDVANMTGSTVGATIYALRSGMAAGTGKWNFIFTGSAPSAMFGGLRLGDNAVPNDLLEVKGFAKLSSDGTITQAGGYHELVSASADFVAHVRNKHAATPEGLRIRFTAAAPNNTTQRFLMCEDSGGQRLVAYSNGNLVNSNNSYGAISDAKLKTGVRDAGPQLADVRALQVRKYRLLADGEGAREQIGLVAQEVELVSPGLVFETPDMETVWIQEFERGGVGELDVPLIGKGEWKDRPTGAVTKGVHYSVMGVKLLKAVQELADMVEAQAVEIAKLQKRRGRP